MSKFWESDLDVGYYDKLFNKGSIKKKGFQFNWHNITFLNIEKYLKKDLNHLDYACGPGTLIGHFSKANSIGVDLSKAQILYAKENYRGEFLSLDQFNYLNYEESFDIITVVGLFEFLNREDIDILLDQLRVMLKPKGRLIITTPNFSLTFKFLIYFSELFGNNKYRPLYLSKFKKNNFYNLFSEHPNYEISEIYKVLNIGLFFSIFSANFGIYMEKFFYKIFNQKVGLLLFVHLIKK